MFTSLLPCPLAGRASVPPSIVSDVRWGHVGYRRSYNTRHERGGLCPNQNGQEDRKVSGQREQRPNLLAVPLLPAAKIMPSGGRRYQPKRLVQPLCKKDLAVLRRSGGMTAKALGLEGKTETFAFGPKRTCRSRCRLSAIGGKADMAVALPNARS